MRKEHKKVAFNVRAVTHHLNFEKEMPFAFGRAFFDCASSVFDSFFLSFCVGRTKRIDMR
jgi:hypothetical protein